MTISIYNLVIHQGATFERYFKFERSLRVDKAFADRLEIDPLPVAIGVGTLLVFAKGSATVRSNYQPGLDTIEIDPYNFAIESSEETSLGRIDFSGYEFDCKLRKDYEGDILATPTISNPQSGVLKMAIDYQTTAQIPHNINYSDLPKNMQVVNLSAPNANPPPYVWQLFGKLGDFRERLAEGKVLVTPDV